MADIVIEPDARTNLYIRTIRGGIFWTSPVVGYVIFLTTDQDLVYRKTADGGATWGGATVIVAAASCNAYRYDCWADWQTEGDAGEKIHIAYMSLDLNQVRYIYLDTSDDSVGGDDLIEACQGTGVFFEGTNWAVANLSLTKTRGGNLAVVVRYWDGALAKFYSFYTSPDGDTWTSEASPWDADNDFCLLFPGNEADNQDVWAVFWDISADNLILKTYDDSGNNWGAQLISANMVEAGSSFSLQMDGQIRLSDGHLILAAWNLYDNANADLMCWDINGAASIVAKTNIITDEADTFFASVFINQVNDDIYVSYFSGTSPESLVSTFYQKSADGGAIWDGEEAMQADVEDDEKWISAGCIKVAWGGMFLPVWFNDDLNDLFCNTDNGISIAGPEANGLESKSALMGVKMIAGKLI